jgi:hypothetical protein
VNTNGTPSPSIGAGRQPAARALLGWLDDQRAPKLCLVAGASGSGRSHLLSWLATARPRSGPATGGRVHTALDAAGLSVRGATWRLGRLLMLATRTPAALAAELAQATEPLVIAVTDLHRAETPDVIVRELLVPLLSLPRTRLLVEVPSGPEPEFTAALTAAAPGPAVLNLDEDRWTDRHRFATWCAKRSAQNVYPNPGLALLTASVRGSGHEGTSGGDICQAWWDALPADLRPVVAALTASPQPLTKRQWAALPGATDQSCVDRAVALLPPEPGGTTWSLRPVGLAGIAAQACPRPTPAETMTALLRHLPRTTGGGIDSATADPELLDLFARHAVRAGSGAQLLADAPLLVRAAPATAAFALDSVPEEVRESALGQAWDQAGPALTALGGPAGRAAALQLYLTDRDPGVRQLLSTVAGKAPHIVWTRWSPAAAMTLGQGPYAETLLTLGSDGQIHEICLADGWAVGRPRPFRSTLPVAFSCTMDGDLLALGRGGHLRVVPPAGDLPEQVSFPARVAGIIAKTFGDTLTALAPLYVYPPSPGLGVGDTSGHVHWFRTFDQGIRSPEALHQGPVTAVAVTSLAAERELLLLSGGSDGRVRAWIRGREPLPSPVEARPCPVTAIAAADTPQGLLFVTAWTDGFVRVGRLNGADAATDLQLGSPVRSAAVIQDGRVVLATDDGLLCLRL